MRFGIAIPHLEYKYSQKLLEGIRQYAAESVNNVLIYAVEEPDSRDSDFSYQEWSISKFMNGSNLDGMIVPTVTLARYASEEKITNIMTRMKEDIPVMSIITEVEGIPSLVVDSEKAFKSLVRHIVFEHGRRKILFIGVDSQSQDIKDRLIFFKEEMAKNGIDVPANHVIFGNYTFMCGVEVMKKNFPTRESVDFDAVMCATDELALGAIEHLLSLGLSVPEDVCVTGFDNTDWGIYSYPSLTSINQNIPKQYYEGLKILERKAKGEDVKMLNVINSECVFRASCGCLEKKSNHILKTADGVLVSRNEDFYSKVFNSLFLHDDHDLRILHFIEELQSYISLEELCSKLGEYLYSFDINQSAICLYESPVEILPDEDYNLPAKARVFYYSDRSTNTKIIDSKKFFNCEKSIFPDGMLEKFRGIHVLRAIYHGKYQYGYMVLSLGSFDSSKYMMIYSLLNKFIASAYEVTQLEERNNNLSVLSNTDELTGILNRRGFNIIAQQELNLSASVGKRGLVIYGDMDGLKYINDTFGHDAGDRAIKAEVELLKKTFREADTIGRLGGDEFAILSVSLTFPVFERLRARLDDFCDEWNRNSNEKFTLSMSLGAVSFDSENYNLSHLLKLADVEQYKVKKNRKKDRPHI